jgi:hypothetical protein
MKGMTRELICPRCTELVLARSSSGTCQHCGVPWRRRAYGVLTIDVRALRTPDELRDRALLWVMFAALLLCAIATVIGLLLMA